MSLQTVTLLLAITVRSSIPVLFATIGAVFTERSGVLNLGIEGIMLMGALSGFAAAHFTQSLIVGVIAAMTVGGLLGLVHGLLTIGLRVNQIVCGLAIAILGSGLSSFLGRPLIGQMGARFAPWPVPLLHDVPFLGLAFFDHVPLVYLAYVLVPAAWLLLFHTRPGLNLRAVGENPDAADAAGLSVSGTRYLWTTFGGALMGLGGAYLSLAYTPGWKENMSAGQGWIAIAMVIFALWNPWRAALGALLFGSVNALQFTLEAHQISLIPSYILRMLPYLFTIAILAVMTQSARIRRSSVAPAALGVPFEREG